MQKYDKIFKLPNFWRTFFEKNFKNHLLQAFGIIFLMFAAAKVNLFSYFTNYFLSFYVISYIFLISEPIPIFIYIGEIASK